MTESKYQGPKRAVESSSVQPQEHPPREGQPDVPHGSRQARVRPGGPAASRRTVQKARKSPGA